MTTGKTIALTVWTFVGKVMSLLLALHSSTRSWKIPWTEEPGGLQSMELHRVRHDWSDLAAAAAVFPIKLKLLKDGFLSVFLIIVSQDLA